MIVDFNSHNIIWRSNSSDVKGKIIEKIINNENMVILNETFPAHINIAKGNFLCIDRSRTISGITQRFQQQLSTYLHKIYTRINNHSTKKSIKNRSWKNESGLYTLNY